MSICSKVALEKLSRIVFSPDPSQKNGVPGDKSNLLLDRPLQKLVVWMFPRSVTQTKRPPSGRVQVADRGNGLHRREHAVSLLSVAGSHRLRCSANRGERQNR